MTLEQRFWAKVKRCRHGQTCKRCCWPWLLTMAWDTYGVFCAGPLRIPAHRFALELARGAVVFPASEWAPYPQARGRIGWKAVATTGFYVLHHCDWRPCCNPLHLFVGTPGDNIRDCRRKQRLRPRGRALLTTT